jgi:DNA-binding response OmpR family regulator
MAKSSDRKSAILIVEDDDDMAALMRLILEKDGWTVHRAVDGKKAKKLMKRLAPPALVTLDIFLPDISGVELILHIRDTPGWEQVPIVMVTAKPRDKDVNWAIKSGATAYLAKPFRQEELRDCVRRNARQEDVKDSEAIERAVYDGMQDLRADKSK